jgi:dihydroceramide fatty acyl 2-hydroxylase
MIAYTDECLERAEGGDWLGEPSERRRRSGHKTIRVFKNPVLELLSRAHPVSPGVWFGPVIAWTWVASPSRIGMVTTTSLFLAGALVFSLFEYGLHRVVFHGLIGLAEKNPKFRFTAFMAHGYHHEFPNDRSRLVMPPMISWPLAAIFFAVYRLLLGPDLYLPLLAGTMAGYIAYDWVHYYTHHFHPRTRLGKWVRAYHLRHHFQDHNAFFGISSPLWDVAFRTYRSPMSSLPR